MSQYALLEPIYIEWLVSRGVDASDYQPIIIMIMIIVIIIMIMITIIMIIIISHL